MFYWFRFWKTDHRVFGRPYNRSKVRNLLCSVWYSESAKIKRATTAEILIALHRLPTTDEMPRAEYLFAITQLIISATRNIARLNTHLWCTWTTWTLTSCRGTISRAINLRNQHFAQRHFQFPKKAYNCSVVNKVNERNLNVKVSSTTAAAANYQDTC